MQSGELRVFLEGVLTHQAPNAITLDAGIFHALRAVGVGCPQITFFAFGDGGSIIPYLQADSGVTPQRRLNNETFRKALTAVQFVTEQGNPSEVPTHNIEVSVTLEKTEAVGVINEIGIFSGDPSVKTPIMNGPMDYDPSLNVLGKDLMTNYFVMPAFPKPNNASMTFTWRLTF